jgi:general secretion pathway protein I
VPDRKTPELARLSGQNWPKHRASLGFSLLEILVAFTVFSLITAVVMQIFSQGVNNAGVADRYARATMIAESKLAAAGIEEALKHGVTSGKTEDEFAWQITIRRYEDPAPRDQQALDFDKNYYAQLYEVVATVRFTTDDNRERSVTLSTLQLGPKPA